MSILDEGISVVLSGSAIPVCNRGSGRTIRGVAQHMRLYSSKGHHGVKVACLEEAIWYEDEAAVQRQLGY